MAVHPEELWLGGGNSASTTADHNHLTIAHTQLSFPLFVARQFWIPLKIHIPISTSRCYRIYGIMGRGSVPLVEMKIIFNNGGVGFQLHQFMARPRPREPALPSTGTYPCLPLSPATITVFQLPTCIIAWPDLEPTAAMPDPVLPEMTTTTITAINAAAVRGWNLCLDIQLQYRPPVLNV
ncbi:hypothetical protein DM02DRAFT_659405 [Periconia macrospinosa]|uniref:Uncharacterized protein n=1 Tax=Periconia macrospinosa TaxID=97972 RepID=A0A2V1DDY8_9PLEO|nr:hypothetical protein DM02DRAFT_659405 [Periconia macrospinosa]